MSETPHPEVVILNAALELPPAARAAYLDHACPGDAALRRQVETLLAAHEQAGDFLETPPTGLDLQRTVQVTPAPTEKPGDRIGRYKLLEQIGEGGFGVVYMAEQVEPVHRKVALKVIKAGMDTKEVVARFEAERQALALMDHPNIARILDAGVTEGRARHSVRAGAEQSESGAQGTDAPYLSLGRPYFVMELVKGIPLTEFCDLKKLSPAERLELFIKVCSAVQHAHQKGIIHRDLKPSNVLVTLHDGEPVPKVIDFGVAKALGQKLTEKTLYTGFAHLIGTPAYMSPEQAELSGLDIDTRSDIYSLGVLLYELLTGVTPFDKESLAKAALDEVRRMIRETEPPKPSKRLTELVAVDVRKLESSSEADRASLRRLLQQKRELIHQVRGDLDWIVMKCLEKDRRRRYETANGLAMDVGRHLKCEPVVARPPSRLYELQKTVRRHKFGFAAAGAIVLVLAAGVVVSTWEVVRATRAEREQVRLRQLAETKEKKSEQVSQFLKDMLEGVGPSVALGRDTTMLREILDQTAERVGKDLKDQPEVEAELRSIMGGVYRSLGEYEKSEAMHRRALELRREVFGDEDPDVAKSLNSLGGVLGSQSRLVEAEALLREALEMQKKLLGDEHPDIATTLNNLGYNIALLRTSTRLPEAEAYLRKALAMQKKLLGNVHPEVASSLGALGVVLRREGKLDEALEAQREGLAIRRELYGNENPYVARSITMLASVLRDQGKLAEAEAAYREGLNLRKKLMGTNHLTVASSLAGLATLLEKMGELAEAEDLFRQSLEMRRKLVGFTNLVEAESLVSLASILYQQGKGQEVEALYREELALRRKTLGDEHPAVVTGISYLAGLLQGQGRWSEVQSLFEEAAATETAQGLNSLAWFLATSEESKVRDGPRAVQLAEKAVAATQRKDPAILDTLAAAHAEAGQFTNAVRVQREAIALLTADHEKEDYSSRLKLYAAGIRYHDDGALAQRASALLAKGNFVEAERLARECLAIREERIPEDWLTFNARSLLGGSLLGQKNYKEAEPLLLSGYEGMKQREGKIPGAGKVRLEEALERLVHLYEASGKTEQAGEWRAKLPPETTAKKN